MLSESRASARASWGSDNGGRLRSAYGEKVTSRPYDRLKSLPGLADGEDMTTPSLTPAAGPTGSRKPSTEHLVLGVVLLVVLAAGAWFLTHRGSSTPPVATVLPKPAATSAAPASVAPTAVTPAAKPAASKVARAAFLKAGNKICATMNARQKALGDLPATTAAQADFLAKNVQLSVRALAQLRALKGPAGDAARLKTMFADVAKTNALGLAAQKRLAAGDQTGAYKVMEQVGDVADKANAAFKAYGLTVCAES